MNKLTLNEPAIRRNTFSGKNVLCIEETERPVFVNNYYAGDNPQQMFCEVRENYSGKCDNLNDKASQSMDDWDVGVARMHIMEEMHPTVEGYHNNQDPPVIVQPNKMQELTHLRQEVTRCQTIVYPH